MEASEFYEQLLALPHLKVDKVELNKRVINIYCHDARSSRSCPNCGGSDAKLKAYDSRRIRDLNISDKEVWLHIRVRQFSCSCGKYFHEQFEWAEAGKSYTRRQSKFIFELCAKQPMKEVGAIVNMCPQSVERVYYAEAEEQIDLAQRYEEVRQLGIDEISHRKGKGNYCCVLVDLEKGRQLDLLPDRKKSSLIAHFESLGPQFCQQIQVVSCDMWSPYAEVARHCFPQARIVIDRFHVVKALNDGLDKARKQLRKAFPQQAEFKRIKWLLFKRPEACSASQTEQLEQAFSCAPQLKQMYKHRNEFHAIFDQSPRYDIAEERLKTWMCKAQKIGAAYWDTFLRTLQNWHEPILNFVIERVSNAATEGLNNLIRYLKRISFNIPNFEHLRIRVLATAF
ncbi:MAG: ISL3 family transposase [Bacteroidota bacterium]